MTDSVKSSDDERWMAVAIAEAEKGLGHTSPNPAVGCVLVRRGRLVGRGYHRRAGLPHAEAEALRRAGAKAAGATAYVTLEPHAHQGRTPPCTRALIAAGVVRVVVGCIDPNPLVAGRGARELRRAGVAVAVGARGAECAEIVRGYRRFVTEGRPFVHLKLAASLDGRIAAVGGDSKWISTRASRLLVQQMRARADAVLVGAGTVVQDDPRLTCRLAGASPPLRVVLDPRLEVPSRAKLLQGPGKVLILASPGASGTRRRALERAGAEVVELATRGRRGWTGILSLLASRNVMEVLLEGGASVATSALRARVVDRVSFFFNPRLLGADGVAMVGSLGVRRPAAAPRLRVRRVMSVGEDLLWEGEPVAE